MSESATVSRKIRRPTDEVAAFVTDPHESLPLISGVGRWKCVGPEGGGEGWDVFLDVGAIQIGGRVLVTRPDPYRLCWRTTRGTEHTFEAVVEPADDGSVLTMSVTYDLSGLLLARLTEFLGRGILTRHLEAAAEEIRHHLEFESGP
ncbi:SRPBCC family protein [Antrihabitans sp. YC2-6]|uniref:SRPBCC family protein n=1 Tax=Antrihabitans sp. YC2-6 TaxID=2799498 RepID=UPI0018F5E6E8|nr:SRPBCC family protein [Antrihabitans sp. YC2-6]MBJ8344281.1 SRPBCC family protein [Antrihabitans sp. YC2-6]